MGGQLGVPAAVALFLSSAGTVPVCVLKLSCSVSCCNVSACKSRAGATKSRSRSNTGAVCASRCKRSPCGTSQEGKQKAVQAACWEGMVKELRGHGEVIWGQKMGGISGVAMCMRQDREEREAGEGTVGREKNGIARRQDGHSPHNATCCIKLAAPPWVPCLGKGASRHVGGGKGHCSDR